MRVLVAFLLFAPAVGTAAEPKGGPLPTGTSARFGSLHFRVPGGLHSSALSPDGKLLAVAGSSVRVYAVPEWRLRYELAVEPGGCNPQPHALSFSPDGRFLAYRQKGELAIVWDVTTGREAQRFRYKVGHLFGGFGGFTADGLYAFAEYGQLVFFDPVTGQIARALLVKNVSHVSPDGKTVVRNDYPEYDDMGNVTHQGDGTAVLADAATGRDFARTGLRVISDCIHNSLAFAADGKTLAVVPRDASAVHVLEAGTGKTLRILTPADKIFAPKDGNTGIHTGGGSPSSYCGGDLGFSPGGKSLWVRVESGDVLRWEVGTWRELPRLKCGTDPKPGDAHFLPDGKTILTPTGEGWVRLWDAATGTETPVPGRLRTAPPDPEQSRLFYDTGLHITLALSPDGKWVAAADSFGRIELLDAVTGEHLRTLRAAGRHPKSMRFSADAALLAVPDGQVSLSILRTSDGAEVRKLNAGTTPEPVAFSPDGRRLVVTGSRAVASWDLTTGEKINAKWPIAMGVVVGPGGGVAVGDGRGVVHIDPSTGGERGAVWFQMPKEWAGGWADFACSGDGRVMAASVAGNDVVVIDAAGHVRNRFAAMPPTANTSAKELAKKNTRSIGPARLSPDGKWVVTSCGAATAVWETATGSPLTTFPGVGTAGLGDGVFTPDGRALLTFGAGGIGYRWELADTFGRSAAKGTAEELWGVAADRPADRGLRAALALVGSDSHRRFLLGKLPPAKRDPDPAQVKKWIAELSDDDFATREAATKELAARARFLQAELAAAAKVATDAEARKRLQSLVGPVVSKPTVDGVRILRLVQAAEIAATPEARELLKVWASGAAGALLTDDAVAALARIAAREKK